ncbi:hypothetical protein QTP86_017102, partial [Hemibagrus guttatus]
MRQVVQAALHCYLRGVLHHDIKPQNILINPDTLAVKLIDFGCGDLMIYEPFREYSECCDLICLCLEQDPSSRPGFRKIQTHKWFKKEIRDSVQ